MANEKFNQLLVSLDVNDVMTKVRADDKNTLEITDIDNFYNEYGCYPDEWYNEKNYLSDMLYDIAHNHDKEKAKEIISALMDDIFDADIIDKNKESHIYYLAIYLQKKYKNGHYNT